MTLTRHLKFLLELYLLVTSVFLSLYSPVSFAGGRDRTSSDTDTQYSDLRGVYYGTVEDNETALVGRVGVILIEPTGNRLVPLDYKFNSGDKFRFQISSNHDGFLYILHRSSDNKLKQLWPHTKNSEPFKIKSGRSYSIPPDRGVFIFDEDVGNEQFYIAVRSEPKVPKLGFLDKLDQADKSVAALDIGENPSTKKPEWVIRGGGPFGEGSTRGVTFDPGTVDGDLYRYFSAEPNDQSTKAMVEIMLNHNR